MNDQPLHHAAERRGEYRAHTLDEQTAGDDPIALFDRWYHDALRANAGGPEYESNVMTLATATPDGRPDARIVLLKGYDATGFTFFTNYDSAKGEQLAANPHAALVFHWIRLERQVRLTGPVTTVDPAESDAYFASRPRDSQLGAWVSNQSRPVERAALDAEYEQLKARYADSEVPRPPHWGGYRLAPRRIEFWQGRTGRLHDRILFEASAAGWQRLRLAP